MKQKYTFNKNQKRLLMKTIMNNKELMDKDIALLLIQNKLFESYMGRADTLRRYITFLRDWFSLRPINNDKILIKEIKKLFRDYPNSTIRGLCPKLQIRLPEYTTRTLERYISTYKNYGTIL